MFLRLGLSNSSCICQTQAASSSSQYRVRNPPRWRRSRFRPTGRSNMASAGGLSPVSSPRLPSPPPFPEVQFGPHSPSMRATSDASTQESELPPSLDTTSSRRIRPGSKSADIAAGLPLVPLSEVLDLLWFPEKVTNVA
jgi:hypothetical protein